MNSMIIYLLTFYQFDDIEKISESLMPFILLRQILTKCTCNLNVYIFYLRLALGIIHGDRCDNNVFYSSKAPFSVVEFSNTVTFFLCNACFDAILTSVTIMKQGFLRKLFFMT